MGTIESFHQKENGIKPGTVHSALTLWILFSQYLQASQREEQFILGLFSGLAVIIGAGARGNSAVYDLLAIGVAIILSFERSARSARLSVLAPVLALVAMLTPTQIRANSAV